jgi:LacI family transcriptional regulator
VLASILEECITGAPHADLLTTANQMGYHAYFSILDINASRKSYKEVIESVLSRQIDGLIVATVSAREAIPFLETIQGRLPYVCMSELSDPQYPAVVYNFEYGAQIVLKHLVSLGHQSIAEINYTHSTLRHNAWEQCAAEHRLNLVSVLTAAYDPEDGYQAAIDLLRRNHAFTAILAGNDVLQSAFFAPCERTASTFQGMSP